MVGVMLLISTALRKRVTEESDYNFAIYEKKNGKTEVFKFTSRKKSTPAANKNTIDIRYNLNGDSSFSYRRRVGDVFGFDISIGPDVHRSSNDGTSIGGGVSIGF